MTAAHCTACHRALAGTSCDARPWIIDGVHIAPTRYGSESGSSTDIAPQCHDCAAPIGAFHHFGCDMERCPHETQATSCLACPEPTEEDAA